MIGRIKDTGITSVGGLFVRPEVDDERKGRRARCQRLERRIFGSQDDWGTGFAASDDRCLRKPRRPGQRSNTGRRESFCANFRLPSVRQLRDVVRSRDVRSMPPTRELPPRCSDRMVSRPSTVLRRVATAELRRTIGRQKARVHYSAVAHRAFRIVKKTAFRLFRLVAYLAIRSARRGDPRCEFTHSFVPNVVWVSRTRQLGDTSPVPINNYPFVRANGPRADSRTRPVPRVREYLIITTIYIYIYSVVAKNRRLSLSVEFHYLYI